MRLPTALLLAALALAWALAADAAQTKSEEPQKLKNTTVVPANTAYPWIMVDKWRKDEYKATGRFPTRCKHCIKPHVGTDPNLN